MTNITLFFILVSVALAVSAQILLKQGMSNLPVESTGWTSLTYSVATNSLVILGIVSYVLSMVFWLYVLSKVEVSRAYPFVGLGFIGTMLFAYYFLNEPITTSKLLGTSMIVIGVVLIARQ